MGVGLFIEGGVMSRFFFFFFQLRRDRGRRSVYRNWFWIEMRLALLDYYTFGLDISLDT